MPEGSFQAAHQRVKIKYVPYWLHELRKQDIIREARQLEFRCRALERRELQGAAQETVSKICRRYGPFLGEGYSVHTGKNDLSSEKEPPERSRQNNS